MASLETPTVDNFDSIFADYAISKLEYAKLLPHIISAFLFINNWSAAHELPLPTKFKLKQSVFTALILQGVFSEELLRNYFASGALQRVWDDLYDNQELSPTELAELRLAVIDGANTNIEIAHKLRQVFLDITQAVRGSEIPYQKALYEMFVSELNLLVDGYEFEAQIKTQTTPLSEADEENYLIAASNSIAIKYVCIVIAFNLVHSDADLSELIATNTLGQLCAETIRLANDLGGQEQDVREGKLNSLSIRMNVHNETFEQARDYYLKRIYANLVEIKSQAASLPNNRFVDILLKITFLATERYLKQNMY